MVFLYIFRGSGGGESSTEQAHIALFRGVFVEKVVAHMGREDLKNDAYMTGIFSMLSTLVEKDFGQLLDCVSVSETVKLALVEHKGILFDILEFSICYERAYWEKATEFILKYNLDDDVIAKSYIDAIAYADDVFGVTHSINL